MFRLIFSALLFLNVYASVFAAVGCSLNDPDRDVKKIFPDSSGYKTTFVTLKEIGGQAIKEQVEARLGDTFDTVYESLDVPYAYYTVLKEKKPVGYIHGVNQKGKFGALQLVLATDLEGKILVFYYQRISSPEASRFQAKGFTDKFEGLSLADFDEYDVSAKIPKPGGRVAGISDPSINSAEDFRATLRGIKKNFILLDEFLRWQSDKGGK